MRYLQLSNVLAVSFASLCLLGCGSYGQKSVAKFNDSSTGITFTKSIHGVELPIKKQVAVVLSISVTSDGDFDKASSDQFTDALRPRSKALKDAGKEPFAVAIAVDFSKFPDPDLAQEAIKYQDTKEVERAAKELDLTADAIQKKYLLFFNDTEKKFKQTFGKPDVDLTAAIVNLKGDILGKYSLPAEQGAALATLDTIIK